MKNEEFLSSLKSLVVDEKRAEKAYRDMMENRYNITSASSMNNDDGSDSSGNIQEIGYEKDEDEFVI